MNSIDEYLIGCELLADDEYVCSEAIILCKKYIYNRVLEAYKNRTCNLLEKIKVPFEKGKKWELPQKTFSYERYIYIFKYNKDYSFNSNYINLFFELCGRFALDFYISSYENNGETLPLLKMFIGDSFVGAIAPIKNE